MFPRLDDFAYIKHKPDCISMSCCIDNKRMVFEINDSAATLLSLCDGTHEMSEIAKYASKKYSEDIAVSKKFSDEFISSLMTSGLIVDRKSPRLHPIVLGSRTEYLPDAFIWELTNVCPLDCKHCYIEEKNHYTSSLEEVNRILGIISEIGVYSVQLTGGEVFMNPHVEYITSELKRLKILTTISTSGVISSDSVWKSLMNISEMDGFVRVSLDGMKDTHNSIRRNTEAFDRTISFIKEALSKNIKCQVATCLIDQSIDEITSLCNLLMEIGVSTHIIDRVLLQGEAINNNVRTAYSIREQNALIETLNSLFASESFSIKSEGKITAQNCGAGYNLFRIRPTLDITPCPLIEENLGSLRHESIVELCSKHSNFYRNIFMPGNNNDCRDCSLLTDCGYCMARALHNRSQCDCKWNKNSYAHRGSKEGFY